MKKRHALFVIVCYLFILIFFIINGNKKNFAMIFQTKNYFRICESRVQETTFLTCPFSCCLYLFCFVKIIYFFFIYFCCCFFFLFVLLIFYYFYLTSNTQYTDKLYLSFSTLYDKIASSPIAFKTVTLIDSSFSNFFLISSPI